jgi:hypothetical protein
MIVIEPDNGSNSSISNNNNNNNNNNNMRIFQLVARLAAYKPRGSKKTELLKYLISVPCT